MSFVLQIEIVAGQRRIYRILSVLHVGYDFVLMTDFVLFVRFKLYLYENNFSQKLMNQAYENKLKLNDTRLSN